MRQDSHPSENSPELTIHLLKPITLPEAFGFLKIGTCKIKGWLYTETICSPVTEILADSGAAFSCISESFVKRFPGKMEPPPTNMSAVDASNKPVNIVGRIVLNIRLQTTNGMLEIQRMVFAVLQVLSVPVIIGCEVLGFLDFEVRTNYAILGGQSIPRIINDNPEDENPVYVIQYETSEAVIVDAGDEDYYTFIRAQPKKEQIAALPSGDFEENLIPDCNFDVASIGSTGITISRPHTRVPGGGELQTESRVFAFKGIIEDIPASLCTALQKSPGVNRRDQNAQIVAIEHQSYQITTKQLNDMIANSALNERKLMKLLNDHKKEFAVGEQNLGTFKRTVSLKLREPTITPSHCKPRIVPYALREWLDD